MVKCIFGQGVRRCTVALAFEAAAVPGVAPPVPGSVKAAASPGPNSGSGSAGVHIEAPGLAGVKLPPSTWHRRRPKCVGAAVLDVERGCMGGGEEEEEGGEKE